MHVLTQVPPMLGYGVVFALVMAESAGIPVPGETTLAAAAVLASQGRLAIAAVIGAAALGAVIGDNLGYLVGRKGGRWLLSRDGFAAERRRRFLAEGERFFERHGGKAVFFARWLPVLRFTAGPLAGAERMRWLRFFTWNALGGVAWAMSIGIAAYLLGARAGNIVEALGLVALAMLIVAVLAHLLWRHMKAAPTTG
jgi:membrane protein DedA with SNARE-associated domain